MNKPGWKDAPEWAMWLAMDFGGNWYWYEFQPDWDTEWEYEGRIKLAAYGINPCETLEARP